MSQAMPLREFPKRIKISAAVQASVLEVTPLAGPEDLTARAIEAVRQWKYRPTKLNGRAVEVQSTVELFVP